MEGTEKRPTSSSSSKEEKETIFPPVNPIITKNFLVVDTLYENAPYSNLPIPGPDGMCMDLSQTNLSSIPQDLVNELPEDCRKALKVAQEREEQWLNTFGSEARDTARRAPIVDKGIIL